MSTNTLYNKYRPKTLDEIHGQPLTVSLLSKQLKNGNLPHSMIFHGTFGTGKTSVARIIANFLNPSIHGIKEQDCTLEFVMDDARKLQQSVDQYPMEGKNKTYIFDEAHNIPQKAFDGLLKIVEEPPSHVYFIFITSAFNKIPDGIKSRSAAFEFGLISKEQVEKRLRYVADLENIKLDDYVFTSLVQKSKGSLREALVNLEKLKSLDLNSINPSELRQILGVPDITVFENLIYAAITKNFEVLMSSVEEINKNSIEIPNTVSMLQKFIIELRFNLVNPEPHGDTLNLVQTLKNSNIDLKYAGRYLDFLYDELVKTYKDVITLPFADCRFRRFAIEVVKTWA